MAKYILRKKNFYTKKDTSTLKKLFLIDANDTIIRKGNKSILSDVYFQLKIQKEERDLLVSIKLLSWSNIKQKYVKLEKSIWSEQELKNRFYIATIEKHYKKIIKKFFTLLSSLRYNWQIKDLIYKMEHPTFIFHYKLLNTFSKQELEKLFLKYYENYPIFNTANYTSLQKNLTIGYSFLPQIINGFYLNGYEISVDSNKIDSAVIEDLSSGIISKKEFLKRLKISEE